MYDKSVVPSFLLPRRRSGVESSDEDAKETAVAFLDHAWGVIPPRVLVQATRAHFRLEAGGNSSWDDLFGETIPACAASVLEVLDCEGTGATVEFGHNVHELFTRLVSCFFDLVMRPGACAAFPVAGPVAVLFRHF